MNPPVAPPLVGGYGYGYGYGYYGGEDEKGLAELKPVSEDDEDEAKRSAKKKSSRKK